MMARKSCLVSARDVRPRIVAASEASSTLELRAQSIVREHARQGFRQAGRRRRTHRTSHPRAPRVRLRSVMSPPRRPCRPPSARCTARRKAFVEYSAGRTPTPTGRALQVPPPTRVRSGSRPAPPPLRSETIRSSASGRTGKTVVFEEVPASHAPRLRPPSVPTNNTVGRSLFRTGSERRRGPHRTG